MRQRVVITGIGMVTPAGGGRESSWRAVCRGRRAVRRLRFGTAKGQVHYLGAPAVLRSKGEVVVAAAARERRIAASGESGEAATAQGSASGENWIDELAELAPAGWAGEFGDRPDRLLELALRAVRATIEQAGLFGGRGAKDDVVESHRLKAELQQRRLKAKPQLDPMRVGCAIADSKGNLQAFASLFEQFQQTGTVDPRLWLGYWPGTLASRIAARFGIEGPTSCPVAACATGLLAIMHAADWIADGRCDVALAGSADSSLCPLVLGSYQRLGVLASGDDPDPKRAVRPFAADRQGFAVGEGSAVFVLESAAHAEQQGAAALAELAGWHSAGDVSNLVGVNNRPEALADCVRHALEKAKLDPRQIGHVNCHGTATSANDLAETQGLRLAFGPHADRLRLTANKSMIGHLLGAAGSVELAITIMALRNQRIPPTVNLDRPDRDCDLDYTPGRSVRHTFDSAVKLSFGFGGHAAAMVVRGA